VQRDAARCGRGIFLGAWARIRKYEEKKMPDDVKPLVRPLSRPPTVRLSPDTDGIQADLGLLADLPGNWHGHGFNLIARPDHDGGGPLFLELNQTDETLKIDPIASPIPNRGFVQSDITLFGLTYLQKISDTITGGALHIEPGIWITQPAIQEPPEQPPNNGQIIARLATIPHGNALLAQGSAINLDPLPGGNFKSRRSTLLHLASVSRCRWAARRASFPPIISRISRRPR
jgi:hypothetical protein